MSRHSYLIALGGNRARSRGIITTLVTPAKAGDALKKSTPLPLAAPAFAGATIVAASRVQTTSPLGPGKRSYANAVALIESNMKPRKLLKHLKSIERDHGRRPGRRWGDRVLDLDIIGWSGGIWASPGLAIPHPAFRERRFVLAPLVEVAPDWRDPVTRLTARQLRARLDRKRPRA
ncbi:MAG: 2-amino-4-hydroxy-6-hydroxymethyldihydropteridine diphosphokinase [Sphingomonadales bacterium]